MRDNHPAQLSLIPMFKTGKHVLYVEDREVIIDFDKRIIKTSNIVKHDFNTFKVCQMPSCKELRDILTERGLYPFDNAQ